MPTTRVVARVCTGRTLVQAEDDTIHSSAFLPRRQQHTCPRPGFDAENVSSTAKVLEQTWLPPCQPSSEPPPAGPIAQAEPHQPPRARAGPLRCRRHRTPHRLDDRHRERVGVAVFARRLAGVIPAGAAAVSARWQHIVQRTGAPLGGLAATGRCELTRALEDRRVLHRGRGVRLRQRTGDRAVPVWRRSEGPSLAERPAPDRWPRATDRGQSTCG